MTQLKRNPLICIIGLSFSKPPHGRIRLQCLARERYEWDLASATAKGRAEGHAEGKTEGRAEGEQHLAQLIQKLTEEGLNELISKVCTDPALRQELYQKYNI